MNLVISILLALLPIVLISIFIIVFDKEKSELSNNKQMVFKLSDKESGIMEMLIKNQVTKFQTCIGCMACESVCKFNAITIKNLEKQKDIVYKSHIKFTEKPKDHFWKSMVLVGVINVFLGLINFEKYFDAFIEKYAL